MTPTLASPLLLPNGSVLPNRLAKAAMEENMATTGQLPGTAIHALYQAWAEGGVDPSQIISVNRTEFASYKIGSKITSSADLQ